MDRVDLTNEENMRSGEDRLALGSLNDKELHFAVEMAHLLKAHGVRPLVLEKVESGCSKVKGCTTKERSFTLPKILEYTKDHCNLNTAPTIISMLNYFLRNAEDSTQEEKNMVDEVERMMLHPDRGDQVTGNKSCFTENAQQVNFTFPSGISAKELMANFPKILKQLKKSRNG